jgi:hypothetical protein
MDIGVGSSGALPMATTPSMSFGDRPASAMARRQVRKVKMCGGTPRSLAQGL